MKRKSSLETTNESKKAKEPADSEKQYLTIEDASKYLNGLCTIAQNLISGCDNKNKWAKTLTESRIDILSIIEKAKVVPHITIGFFGETGDGKSFIINSLLSRDTKDCPENILPSKKQNESVTLYPTSMHYCHYKNEARYWFELKNRIIEQYVSKEIYLERVSELSLIKNCDFTTKHNLLMDEKSEYTIHIWENDETFFKLIFECLSSFQVRPELRQVKIVYPFEYLRNNISLLDVIYIKLK